MFTSGSTLDTFLTNFDQRQRQYVRQMEPHLLRGYEFQILVEIEKLHSKHVARGMELTGRVCAASVQARLVETVNIQVQVEGASHPGQGRRLPDEATHSRPWRRLPRSRAIDSGRRPPRVHSGKVKRLRVASVGALDGGQAGRPMSRRILRDLPDTVKG